MTKEVEDIIRHKSWSELTSTERSTIAEWAGDEEEYSQMRWFLTESSATFRQDRIKARPELKKGVMAAFEESDRKPVIWLNSVGAFLLPDGKKIYQKPGVQLAVAAVLVVGFLWLFQMDFKDSSLAQQDIEQINETPLIPNSNNSSNQIENDQTINDQDEIQPVFELEDTEREINREQTNEMGELKDDISNGQSNFEQQQPPAIVAEEDVLFDPALEEEFEVVEGEENRVFDAVPDEVDMVEKTIEERKDDSGPGAADDEVAMEEEVIETFAEQSDLGPVRSKRVEMTNADYSTTQTNNASTNADRLFFKKGVSATEEIVPKSLHIDQTKELKNLYFTVK